MIDLQTIAERVRKGESLPFLIAAALSMAEPLYQLGMWYRLRQPRIRIGAHIISFGNITAGGTGKTPAVIERAQREVALGKKVGILTRGYKAQRSTSKNEVVVVGPLTEIPQDRHALCEQVGDEAALILLKVPSIRVFRCPDRVQAARLAVETYECDTLILDDGYQYVQLERDENILVIDASNPFGNGRGLPRGILRESPGAMERATALLLTRCDQAGNLPALRDLLKERCPDIPIRCTTHAPDTLWRINNGELVPLEALRHKPVRAICGIGNPEAFFRTLETLGAEIKDRVIVPDHGGLPQSAFVSDDLIVMTEKDAMRVTSALPQSASALGIRLADYG